MVIRSPHSVSLVNKREDGYGSDVDGRMRMLNEVYDKIRSAVGGDYPIGIRINGDDFIKGGNTLQQSRIIARRMAEKRDRLYKSVCGGRYERFAWSYPQIRAAGNYPPFGGYSGERAMPPAYMPEAVNVYLADDIRKTVRQAVIPLQ